MGEWEGEDRRMSRGRRISLDPEVQYTLGQVTESLNSIRELMQQNSAHILSVLRAQEERMKELEERDQKEHTKLHEAVEDLDTKVNTAIISWKVVKRVAYLIAGFLSLLSVPSLAALADFLKEL